jgi:transposase
MLPSSVRVLVCTTPLDLRKSFDGLALAARELLGENPQSGAIFCFANRRMNRIKLLWFDRSGYCLLYKRMHGARVAFPIGAEPASACVALDGRALHALLAGVPKSEKRRNLSRK